MARKVFLPLTQGFADAVEGPPTVDSMRARLGGRVEDAPPAPIIAGTFVSMVTPNGTERIGVLLCGDEAISHVYLERGIVKRTQTDLVRVHGGEPPSELAAIARQIRVFASLTEGQEVHVERGPGRTQSGVLREKCRYGALVELPEGKLLGVGFGKLWPAVAGGGQSGSAARTGAN
jgi:hypothetical protein